MRPPVHAPQHQPSGPPRNGDPFAARTTSLEFGNSPADSAARSAAQCTQARAVAGVEIVRSVFTVVGPAAVQGIAVGATALLLAHAAPDLHALLISVVWISAFLTSAAIVAGLQCTRRPPVVDLDAEWNAVNALRAATTAAAPPKNA